MISFICDVNLWFDKINGNTYHCVNIFDIVTDKYIYSSGLTYGCGSQYEETTKEVLIKLNLLKRQDKYNHDYIRSLIKYNVNQNALKRDLKKMELEE